MLHFILFPSKKRSLLAPINAPFKLYTPKPDNLIHYPFYMLSFRGTWGNYYEIDVLAELKNYSYEDNLLIKSKIPDE